MRRLLALAMRVAALAPMAARGAPAPDHAFVIVPDGELRPEPTTPGGTESAYGCNMNVCIRVVGHSNAIWLVETWAYPASQTLNATAHIDFRYPSGASATATSPYSIVIPQSTFWTRHWGYGVLILGRTLPNLTRICTRWTGSPSIAGYPCQTVFT